MEDAGDLHLDAGRALVGVEEDLRGQRGLVDNERDSRSAFCRKEDSRDCDCGTMVRLM